MTRPVMLTPQMDGDCNRCHEDGADAAPGRIFGPAPEPAPRPGEHDDGLASAATRTARPRRRAQFLAANVCVQ
jgi:hypothetical protein